MLEIGSFIKMQRTKQKMTLEELADGVISISYLSKIENLKTEPSPHIVEELSNRLGISMDREQDDFIEEKSRKWFTMLRDNHDKTEVMQLYDELEELINTNISDSILLFELHKIQYYLFLNDTESALKQIKAMKKAEESFEIKERYYWNKFQGNYAIEAGEFNVALRNYRKAEKYSRQLDLREEEFADLNCSLAIAYSHVRQVLEAIEYANVALNIYMQRYQFLRCSRCHIVLGVSYKRIKMYDKAVENFNLAKQLASLNQDQELIQRTNYHLALLYSTIGKNSKAIALYLEIIEAKEIKAEEKVITLTELVKVYYERKEMDKAIEKINLAFELLRDLPANKAYQYYNYVLHTYYYAIHNQKKKFVSLIKNKLIPFLSKEHDYANLAIFTTMLAKHYEKNHKYKDATKYYEQANQSYSKLSVI